MEFLLFGFPPLIQLLSRSSGFPAVFYALARTVDYLLAAAKVRANLRKQSFAELPYCEVCWANFAKTVLGGS